MLKTWVLLLFMAPFRALGKPVFSHFGPLGKSPRTPCPWIVLFRACLLRTGKASRHVGARADTHDAGNLAWRRVSPQVEYCWQGNKPSQRQLGDNEVNSGGTDE